MKKQIKSCAIIQAKGKKLYSFINAVHNEKLHCFAQYCRNDTFTAQIYIKDLKKIRQLADENEIEFNYKEIETVSSNMKKYRKRIGFTLGIIAVLLSFIYFSRIIITIEIVGNNSVSDDSILTALRKVGIEQGTPIKDIDFISAENQLMVMINGVSWVGMQNNGNRLVVQITETVDKPEMVNSRIPCNVVASHDAEIVSTRVYDGMLMKIVGSYVHEGDMLINGVTSDNTGHTTFHHAMGEITGIYNVEKDFSEPFSRISESKTGNETTHIKLKLFNLKIPLYFGNSPYSSCKSEITEKNIKIFGNYLPIGIIKEKFAETELSEKTFSQEEAEQKIMDSIYLYEKNFLNEDVEIIDRKITKQITDKEVKYSVSYRIKGDISRESEIYVKTE